MAKVVNKSPYGLTVWRGSFSYTLYPSQVIEIDISDPRNNRLIVAGLLAVIEKSGVVEEKVEGPKVEEKVEEPKVEGKLKSDAEPDKPVSETLKEELDEKEGSEDKPRRRRSRQ